MVHLGRGSVGPSGSRRMTMGSRWGQSAVLTLTPTVQHVACFTLLKRSYDKQVAIGEYKNTFVMLTNCCSSFIDFIAPLQWRPVAFGCTKHKQLQQQRRVRWCTVDPRRTGDRTLALAPLMIQLLKRALKGLSQGNFTDALFPYNSWGPQISPLRHNKHHNLLLQLCFLYYCSWGLNLSV